MKTKKKKTISEHAASVGISRRQLTRNIEDGCPRTTPAAIKKWRQDNVRTRTKPDGELQEELLRAKLGTEQQRGQKLEAENAQLREKLIESRTVREDIAAVRDSLDIGLAKLPETIVAGLEISGQAELQNRVKKRVQKTVRLVMAESTNSLENIAAEKPIKENLFNIEED